MFLHGLDATLLTLEYVKGGKFSAWIVLRLCMEKI
jgi:hypothetical protein